eukprot:3929910-Pleurochrysis_carterae.AAC.1
MPRVRPSSDCFQHELQLVAVVVLAFDETRHTIAYQHAAVTTQDHLAGYPRSVCTRHPTVRTRPFQIVDYMRNAWSVADSTSGRFKAKAV